MFDPKRTDVDEHIDLINTLGDMVDQKEEAKKEKFIETVPTMIQTHLIICKDWADVKDKAKSLKHIIQKCDSPTPAMPLVTTGATVPGLYLHITNSVGRKEGEIPPPIKGTKPKQTRGRGLQQAQQYQDYICISQIQWPKKKGKYPHQLKAQNQNKPEVEGNLKENLRVIDRTHQKPKRQMKTTLMIALTIITTMIIILPQAKTVAADLFMVKAVINNLEASHREAEVKDLNTINANFRTIGSSEVHIKRIVLNMALTANPIFREIKQMTTEDGALARILSTSEDTIMVGPIMALTSISIIHMINRQNSMSFPVACAVVSIIPLSTATKENMT